MRQDEDLSRKDTGIVTSSGKKEQADHATGSRLTSDDLRALALSILRQRPAATVRARLLRDVICVAERDERLAQAIEQSGRSPHAHILEQEQRADGSWGRLHSRDTSARQRIPTTEFGVARALALGLDRTHPILNHAMHYLAAVIDGRVVPPDPPEKNDRWGPGIRLFGAATLAQIDPEHRALDPVWTTWLHIAKRSFASGTYDPSAEIEAHAEWTGATVAGSYLVLSNRYPLTLLSARSSDLPDELRAAITGWIYSSNEGIGMLDVPLSRVPEEGASASTIERWIRSHELLSRFRPVGTHAKPLFDWLASCRDDEGWWDLGLRATGTPNLPLSDSWRKKGARATDWSVRVLSLLARLMGLCCR